MIKLIKKSNQMNNKMYNQKKSLYLLLFAIIILSVTIIISISSAYSYVNIKNHLITDMKNNSDNMVLELKNNIKNLVASYSINEYEKVLFNEMESNDILLAICFLYMYFSVSFFYFVFLLRFSDAFYISFFLRVFLQPFLCMNGSVNHIHSLCFIAVMSFSCLFT